MLCRDSDGFVSATRLCNDKGKLFGNYFKTKTNKNFIDMLQVRQFEYLSLWFIVISKQKELGTNVIEINKGGQTSDQQTWVHPRVAEHIKEWLKRRKDSVCRKGIIYFIRQENTDLTKIGFTTDSIEARTFALQAGNPNNLLPFAFFESDDCPLDEAKAHLYFKEQWITREWFNITEKDIHNYVVIVAKKEFCPSTNKPIQAIRLKRKKID